MDEQAQEDELALRQGGRLYPVGKALRATFDAENHDSLGSDVTGLMMDLSHIDMPAPPPPCQSEPPRSLVSRVRVLLGR